MKECIAIILTILIAAWFWVSWWHDLQLYVAEKNAITATLEKQGLTRVRVYPKSAGCYTYNALKNEMRSVSGKVCLDGEQ